MKLKKAIKKAKKLPHVNWIAVEKNNMIFGYENKPITKKSWVSWKHPLASFFGEAYSFIGNYTGKKNWKKTLRRVR